MRDEGCGMGKGERGFEEDKKTRERGSIGIAHDYV